jgi:hypothetical protein
MLGGLAQPIVLRWTLAAADTENETPAGQAVDRDRLARELVRAAPWPTHGSHIVLSNPAMWSQMKKPSQPLASASSARDTMVAGFPNAPKFGR